MTLGYSHIAKFAKIGRKRQKSAKLVIIWVLEGLLHHLDGLEPRFLSTTEFTIPSQTMILQRWVSDVCMSPIFVIFHDVITFERFKLEG